MQSVFVKLLCRHLWCACEYCACKQSVNKSHDNTSLMNHNAELLHVSLLLLFLFLVFMTLTISCWYCLSDYLVPRKLDRSLHKFSATESASIQAHENLEQKKNRLGICLPFTQFSLTKKIYVSNSRVRFFSDAAKSSAHSAPFAVFTTLVVSTALKGHGWKTYRANYCEVNWHAFLKNPDALHRFVENRIRSVQKCVEGWTTCAFDSFLSNMTRVPPLQTTEVAIAEGKWLQV